MPEAEPIDIERMLVAQIISPLLEGPPFGVVGKVAAIRAILWRLVKAIE